MDDLLSTFGLMQVLLFVLCVQLVAAFVSAFILGKPGLAVMGAAIQAATGAAVAVLLVMPGPAGRGVAAIFAVGIGIAVFYLTNKAIMKGKTNE